MFENKTELNEKKSCKTKFFQFRFTANTINILLTIDNKVIECSQ